MTDNAATFSGMYRCAHTYAHTHTLCKFFSSFPHIDILNLNYFLIIQCSTSLTFDTTNSIKCDIQVRSC